MGLCVMLATMAGPLARNPNVEDPGAPGTKRRDLTHYPPSATHYPLSTIHYPLYPLSTIHCPLSTINYPLSAVRCPLSTVHYQLSTIHCPLSTAFVSCSTVSRQRAPKLWGDRRRNQVHKGFGFRFSVFSFRCSVFSPSSTSYFLLLASRSSFASGLAPSPLPIAALLLYRLAPESRYQIAGPDGSASRSRLTRRRRNGNSMK